MCDVICESWLYDGLEVTSPGSRHGGGGTTCQTVGDVEVDLLIGLLYSVTPIHYFIESQRKESVYKHCHLHVLVTVGLLLYSTARLPGPSPALRCTTVTISRTSVYSHHQILSPKIQDPDQCKMRCRCYMLCYAVLWDTTHCKRVSSRLCIH